MTKSNESLFSQLPGRAGGDLARPCWGRKCLTRGEGKALAVPLRFLSLKPLQVCRVGRRDAGT